MDYTKLKDEELVKLSQDNNIEARETLIKRYKKAIYKVARLFYLEGGDIEDLVVEGMVGIDNAISSYSSEVPFVNYAFICIKRSILSTIKKANRNKNLPLKNYISISGSEDDDLDKSLFMSSDEFNPEEKYINCESKNELVSLIYSSLSTLEQKVLKLFLQGYSYSDISKSISKSTKTIDNAIQRIRKKLDLKINEKV